MSANALAKRKWMGWREAVKLPRVDLYDESHRLWGFFMPEDASMLKKRAPEEWFKIGIKLLVEAPFPGKLQVIPFEEDGGSIRGKFYLTPWSDEPSQPLRPLTDQEIAALTRASKEPGKNLSWEEVMDEFDRALQADDPENGEIGSSA